MSYSAVDWAMAQALTPSARKFLLVALAHHTNSQGGACYPSIARLAETTALDRKTVIAHLSALETAGFISDTGQRHGTTKQVKEYRLSMSKKAEQSPAEQSQNRNGSETGTVPLFPSNSTAFPSKESQKRDTEQGSEQVREQGKRADARVGSKAAHPSCPQQKLLELYRECLPSLPQPRVWDGARERNLRTRWRWVLTTKKASGERYATDEATGLDFFRRFFGYVGKSDFLTGRDGKWTACDLPWLVKAENFAKVLEGKYENREAA